MNISVVGLGYVGLSISLLLAKNHTVYGVDLDQDKINKLKNGVSPLDDPDMVERLKDTALNFHPTTDFDDAIAQSDFVVIATPTDYDESIDHFDTRSVRSVAKNAIDINNKVTIIIKSTINIGLVDSLRADLDYQNIFFSPEFLREGRALHDNMYPSRIIIGGKTERAYQFAEMLLEASSVDECPILTMDTQEAEAVKLFANAYLAMRVAYFNELDSFCIANKLNSRDIINGVSLEPRIRPGYNNPSFGYGGYCFPKDTKQMVANFKETPQNLMTAIVESNQTRKDYLTRQIAARQPKIVGVYKLSMKAGSDNYRSSAVFGITKALMAQGIRVIFYDESVHEESVEGIERCSNFDQFISASDVILANRMEAPLEPFAEKVFSRDVFGND